MAKGLEMPDADVPAKAGKIIASRGKYFVQVGATKKELPVGTLISEAQAKTLAGKNVGVYVSGKSIVAIAPWDKQRFKKPWIICYLPAPDLFKRINERLRDIVRETYLQEGILSQEVAAKLELVR